LWCEVVLYGSDLRIVFIENRSLDMGIYNTFIFTMERAFPEFRTRGRVYDGTSYYAVVPSGTSVMGFTAPLSTVFLAIAVWLGLGWTISILRVKWRERRGLCRNCGYDLRGSAGGKCSECGGVLPEESILSFPKSPSGDLGKHS